MRNAYDRIRVLEIQFLGGGHVVRRTEMLRQSLMDAIVEGYHHGRSFRSGKAIRIKGCGMKDVVRDILDGIQGIVRIELLQIDATCLVDQALDPATFSRFPERPCRESLQVNRALVFRIVERKHWREFLRKIVHQVGKILANPANRLVHECLVIV